MVDVIRYDPLRVASKLYCYPYGVELGSGSGLDAARKEAIHTLPGRDERPLLLLLLGVATAIAGVAVPTVLVTIMIRV